MTPLFLVNPESATVRKRGSTLDRLSGETGASVYHLSDFSALPDIVQSCIGRHNRVFIEGGDGTVHGVMTAFMRRRDMFGPLPKFSILPGGMTNQVAGHIGVKYKSRTALRRLLEGTIGESRPMPLLHVTSPDIEDHFGFLFSSGAVPMGTDYCKQRIHDKGIGGSLAVAVAIARIVGGFKKLRDEVIPPTPVKLRITSGRDEIWLGPDHLGTLVSTLPGLMLGIDPFWGEGDGPLRATFLHADAEHLLGHIIGMIFGKGEKKTRKTKRQRDGFESFRADVLHYEYDGPTIIDGESLPLSGQTLEIRATEPVEFIV